MPNKEQNLIDDLFKTSENIRYVAIYANNVLHSAQRDNIAGASAGESDKYEELFVNPGILKLAKQRGELDCGGFDYVLIKYGNFFQFVAPRADGHISICLEPHDGLLATVASVRVLLTTK